MTESNLPEWYSNYGSFMINEQNNVPPQLQDRLKEYLNNDSVLGELVKAANSLEHLGNINLELDPITHGVDPGDTIIIEVHKLDTELNKSWVMATIENEGMIIGDIDIDVAAGIINEAIAGLGTDEEAFSAVCAAIHKDAADRGVKADVIFKALSRRYNEMFDETLKDAIEGDYSGRAEVTSLIIAGQEVEPSFWRGFNPLAILGDVALLFIPVVGWAGLAAKYGITAVKGTSKTIGLTSRATKIADRARNLKLAAKSSKAGQVASRGAVFNHIKKAVNAKWLRINSTSKIKAIQKAGINKGSKIPWTSTVGNKGTAEVVEFLPKTGMVNLKHTTKGGKVIFKESKLDTFLAQASVEHSTKVAKAAGIITRNQELLGKVAVIGGRAAERGGVPGGPSGLETAGEFMGYYDTATADPNAEYDSYKDQSAGELATGIRKSAKGWTSNSEELSISLMILALEKDGAVALASKWNQMHPEDDFSSWVIESEIEWDMAQSVGMYWAALTGEGLYNEKVVAMHARINPNAQAPVAPTETPE